MVNTYYIYRSIFNSIIHGPVCTLFIFFGENVPHPGMCGPMRIELEQLGHVPPRLTNAQKPRMIPTAIVASNVVPGSMDYS